MTILDQHSNSKKKGYFFTLEGIDGSGKTTQVENIISFLRNIGYEVSTYREPGGTELGEKIRSITKTSTITPLAELLLYYAARVELLLTKVKPDLEKGKIVILDRYIDSSYAYQGSLHNLHDQVETLDSILPDPNIDNMSNWTWVEGYLPHTTFYLKVSPETSYLRSTKDEQRDGQDANYDELAIEKRANIIKHYDFLCTTHQRFITIDAEQDQDNVWDQIYQHLQDFLNQP